MMPIGAARRETLLFSSLLPPCVAAAFPRRRAVLAGSLRLSPLAGAIDLLRPLCRPIRLHPLALRLAGLCGHSALALRFAIGLRDGLTFLLSPLRPVSLHA